MKQRATPIVRSLADLLTEVEAGLGFAPRRQQDIASDLRTLARLAGRPLSDLPAEPRALRALFAGIHPVQAGISKKRLQNLRANVSAALHSVRTPSRSPLSQIPMDSAWQTLYDQLTSKNLRYALSGFARYCSRVAVEPCAVDDAVAAAYHRELVDTSLRKHPNRVYRDTCRAWNQARLAIEDWPAATLKEPSFRPPNEVLPIDAFPSTLGDDLDRYLRWLGGGDLLAPNQPRQICKASTLKLRRNQVLQLASAAVHHGFETSSLDGLSALVSRPVIEAGVQHYLDRYDGPTSFIRDLVKTAKRIARDWAGSAPAHLAWLQGLIRRLDTHAPGLTEKNRATLRQFDSPANVQRLLTLPAQLMAQCQKTPSRYKAAHLYAWGLAIEILTVAPMRIGNLAGLRIDQHLVRPEGPKGPVIISLRTDETKNRVPVDYPLPFEVARHLDHYIHQHRPALVTQPDCPWLWPARDGDHKSIVTMSERIRDLIYRETGLRMTPHQFRHLAAKLILEGRPGAYELARQVLGHQHVSTTVNFYAGMQTAAAVNLYDDILDGHRTRRKADR